MYILYLCNKTVLFKFSNDTDDSQSVISTDSGFSSRPNSRNEGIDIDGSRPKFITSEKNKPLLRYHNHIYNKKLTSKTGVISWLCTESFKYKSGCKGRVKTRDAEVIQIVTQHNHLADAIKADKRRQYDSKILDEAKTTIAPPQLVIAKSLEGTTDNVLRSMATYTSLNHKIQRQRERCYPTRYYANPDDISKLTIPDDMKSIKVTA